MEQVFGQVACLVICPTHRETNRYAVTLELDVDAFEPAENRRQRCRITFSEHKQKFIAAQANRQVSFADALAEAIGEPLQDHVASRMTEAVVDLLEVVKIEKHYGQSVTSTAGSRDFHPEMPFGEPAVIQTRKWIG